MLQVQRDPASVSERDEAAPTWATALLWNSARGLSLSLSLWALTTHIREQEEQEDDDREAILWREAESLSVQSRSRNSHSWDILGCFLPSELLHHDDCSTAQWTRVWVCQQWDGWNQSGTYATATTFFNLIVCCFYAYLGVYSVFYLIKRPLGQCLTIHHFHPDILYVILLINVWFFIAGQTELV